MKNTYYAFNITRGPEDQKINDAVIELACNTFKPEQYNWKVCVQNLEGLDHTQFDCIPFIYPQSKLQKPDSDDMFIDWKVTSRGQFQKANDKGTENEGKLYEDLHLAAHYKSNGEDCHSFYGLTVGTWQIATMVMSDYIEKMFTNFEKLTEMPLHEWDSLHFWAQLRMLYGSLALGITDLHILTYLADKYYSGNRCYTGWYEEHEFKTFDEWVLQRDFNALLQDEMINHMSWNGYSGGGNIHSCLHLDGGLPSYKNSGYKILRNPPNWMMYLAGIDDEVVRNAPSETEEAITSLLGL